MKIISHNSRVILCFTTMQTADIISQEFCTGCRQWHNRPSVFILTFAYRLLKSGLQVDQR